MVGKLKPRKWGAELDGVSVRTQQRREPDLPEGIVHVIDKRVYYDEDKYLRLREERAKAAARKPTKSATEQKEVG